MKFSLIDAVVDFQPGTSITTIKNLTRAEEYLGDHFPGFPVMPGVLMLETLVQAGAWVVRESSEFAYSTVLLNEVKALRFKSFVSPGDQLRVVAQKFKSDGPLWTFRASGTCGETEVVSARITVKQFNLADSNPNLSPNDERLKTHLLQLWEEIRPRTNA